MKTFPFGQSSDCFQANKEDLVLDIHVRLLGYSEEPQWKENQEEKEGKGKMNFK